MKKTRTRSSPSNPLTTALAFIESHKSALIGVECTPAEYEKAIKPFAEYIKLDANQALIAEQAAEIARLRTALEFYAELRLDRGRTAREALQVQEVAK